MPAMPTTPPPIQPPPGAAHPGAPVVQAQALSRIYGRGAAQVLALDSVSLSVARGEFVAIMGPSGSGKSTLLHCLAGLDSPTSGRVLIAGQDLAGMGDKRLTAVRRDRLGFVFQSFNLLPTLTAQENILLPLRLAGRRPDEGWYRTIIDILGIGDRLGHRPSELSGGQQQRVAVARALVGRPEVVFADEPTGALDTASAASLLSALAQMCEHLGQTVVMVTHDQDAAGATHRIIRLRDGRIEADAPTRRPAPAGPPPVAPAAPHPGHAANPDRPWTGVR
ncbi:ABC transporter ATP-binding protein [Actinomyces capricornis]|uniref:ABC transporter ATP-binding protein n=2 Tax=Actinomyces capricornis TaxID=2755559 RepID=A0ABN6K702_9ACTO|nr:ABC transporter ATP-binding protein [Actinomyces capricornis]